MGTLIAPLAARPSAASRSSLVAATVDTSEVSDRMNSMGCTLSGWSVYPVATNVPPLARHRTPAVIVSVVPTSSKYTSAPRPAVSSRTAAGSSPYPCPSLMTTPCVAPWDRARSRFSAESATAITRAPAARAAWTTRMPTPPMPSTTAVPPSRSPDSLVACTAVIPAQVSTAAVAKSTDAVEAKLAVIAVADVVPAAQALFARTAEELVVDRHPVTGGQRGAAAHRLDHAGRLVADGHGVGVGLDHAVQDVQVGPAHPGGLDPHQGLARPRRRNRKLIDPQAQVLEDSGSA